MFHLANANEFNADEAKAREQYGRLVKDYSATDAGKKAAGALRRLDLVGKPLAITGTGLQNDTVDSSKYRGKPVLIVFWASWATPVKQDLPELIKLYEKHKKDGLQIIGVNLDNDRAELDAFLKEHQISWPQIFEPGGMESRLAVDYGIILLAQHVPGRFRRQGREPQPPNLGRGRPPARKDAGGETGERGG